MLEWISTSRRRAQDDLQDERVYRVSVRGRFGPLDGASRARLEAAAPCHDVVLAEFTERGTLAYGLPLQTFTFRYQLRERGEDTELKAMAEARSRAIASLAALGVGYRELQIRAMDMDDLWR